MKLFKVILYSILCITQYMIAQTEPISILSDSTPPTVSVVPEQEKTLPLTETTASEMASQPIAEKTADVPVIEKEKDEKEKWNDHLKNLLTKGAFWNSSNNAPTTDWQDDAVQYAQEVLKKEPSMVEELKTSFLNTVENKFTNIESASNLKVFFEVIDNFNKKIDSFLTELTLEKEKKEIKDKVSEEEKSLPEGQIQEGSILPVEETIEPETTLPEETKELEKKQNKQESKWQECLQNIRSEGKEDRETDIIIEDTITTAKDILLSLSPNEQSATAITLKNEFKTALSERDRSLYTINIINTIQQFNKAINAVLPSVEPQQPKMASPEIFEKQQPISQEKKGDKNMQDITTTSPLSSSQKAVIEKPAIRVPGTPASTIFTNIQAQIAERAHIEAAQRTKESQEMLAKKIKMAALEKAAAEKAEAEKGIVSALAESIFGEWWAPKTHKKALEKLQSEQEKIIVEMTRHKFDPHETEQIRNAYVVFQQTLLAFNTPKYWDQKRNIPNAKWIKDIEKPLESYLVRYKIMTIDSIIEIVKTTLHTSTKSINVREYDNLIKTMTHDLQNAVNAIEEEKAKVQKQKQREEKQQQEEELNRERREKEQARLLQQQEKIAAERFKVLQQEWNALLQDITSHPLSQDILEKNTSKAVAITSEIIGLRPLDKQTFIEKYKTDFSHALVQQHRMNEQKYVYDCMDTFLKGIHNIM